MIYGVRWYEKSLEESATLQVKIGTVFYEDGEPMMKEWIDIPYVRYEEKPEKDQHND